MIAQIVAAYVATEKTIKGLSTKKKSTVKPKKKPVSKKTKQPKNLNLNKNMFLDL